MRFVPLDKPEPVEAEQPQFTFVPLDEPVPVDEPVDAQGLLNQAAQMIIDGMTPDQVTAAMGDSGITYEQALAAATAQGFKAPVAAQQVNQSYANISDPETAMLAGIVGESPVTTAPAPRARPGAPVPTGLSAELAPEQFKSGLAGMQQGFYTNAAKNNAQQLAIIERIEKGEKVRPEEDVLGYKSMDPEMRKQTKDALQAALTSSTARVVKYGYEKQGYKRNPTADKVINLANSGQYKDAWKAFTSDPTGVIQQLSVESAPNILPSVAGGAVSVVLRGGLAGLMTGLATGSFPVEFNASLVDSLNDAKVDMNDVKAIEAKLKDPKFMDKVAKRAMSRATIISAADAASGKLLMPFKAGQTGKNVARAAANLGIETGLEAGGEAAAQAVTGEEFKVGDIVAEALGAGPAAGVQTVLSTLSQPSATTAQPSAPAGRVEPTFTPTTPTPVTPSVTPAVPSAPVSVTPPAAPAISPVIPETDIEGVEEPEAVETAKSNVIDITEQLEAKDDADLEAGILKDEKSAGVKALTPEVINQFKSTLNLAKQAVQDTSGRDDQGNPIFLNGKTFFGQDGELANTFAEQINSFYDGLTRGTITNAAEEVRFLEKQAKDLEAMFKRRIDEGKSAKRKGLKLVEPTTVEEKPATEATPESEDAALARMSAEEIQDQIAKIKSQPGQSLYNALKFKVAIDDVKDVSPDKTFNMLRGKNGVPISDMVADGNLDEWLPFDMRSDSVTFDEQMSTEYIKDKLRSQNYLPYETELEIQKLGEDFARADAAYSEILRIEDVNKELDAITNEERGLSAEDQAAAIAAQEGIPARTEGQVPAEDFALTQETEEDIRAREASLEDREQKAIADREREAFALQAQQQPLQAPPTGDMFGATDITQQPGKKPRIVPTGPTALEAAAQPVNVDQAVAQRLKKAGLDDLDTASENVQKERGVSKPVADALVRAYQKQMTVMVRSQYGQATEKEIKDTSAAVDKLEKRLEGMKKRKKTIEAKKEEAKPAAVAEPKKETPAPMPGAKGKQPPILKAPEGFELKAGRNEQVALAAEKLANGEITRTEYDQYVDYYMPVFVVPSPEAPLNAEGMKRVLDKNQAEKVNPEIKDGTRVGLRMDLKALRRGKQIGQNGSVVSIHEGMPVESSRQGKIIGYGGAARAKNVQFAIRDQKRSFGVARNVEDKAPQQTIEGEWINDTPENIYAEAKRLMNDPAWSQVSLDPMRHSFFYDRKNMQPVISADEVLQVGRFVIAKNVKYAPREQFLYNIEVGYIEPKVINGMALDSRDARISQYARVRQKRASLLSKVEKQGGTLDIQRELNRLREAADYLKVELALTKERKDSAKDFLSKALNENVKGNIDDDVFDSIQWMYNNAPGLLNGLLLSVKRYPEKGLPGTEPAVSGEFLPVARIIRLYKGTRGVENSSVIRHEITHTMEQMMDEGARNAVINSWRKSFQKELDTTTDPKVKKFLNATLDFLERPSQEKYQVALNAMPGYKYYQFLGPSEYWAVNAEKLMKAQMGPVWERFKKNLTKLIQYLKNLFGFDNTYVFHQVFDGIMRGDMKRFDTKALIDYVTVPGISSSFLKNVEDTDRLHAQYDVPDTPLDASDTLKDRMLGAANTAKNAAKDAVNNPLGTAAQMVGSLDRGLIDIRNQNVWFGTGLDVADFRRYNGQLRDANGKVAASIAVTQAMHGGHVGTNVIRRGALQFNSDTQLFQAVDSEMSMANVVRLKHELTKKLGKQRAANVINTYFVAKRARSIQNEYFDRSFAFENSAPGSTDKAENGVALDQVIRAYEKIPTFLRAKDMDGEYLTTKITNSAGKEVEVYVPDDEAIDSFIAQENDYTQLADMSKNWSAVNRNMLDNMYFAGILSKKRYETLIGIKDYVPWYRVMDDMSDVHEPTSGIVRGMTNVPRERHFGRGSTDRDVDDVIDNMLHNVLMLTKNVMRNHASNRVAQEYATRNDKGKIKVYDTEGKDDNGVRTNILVAGRRIIVQIKDPLIAQAVIGMESFEIPSNKILAAMANLFRRTITLAPVFQVKQLFKDAPMAAWYSNTKNPFAVWGNVFSSFVSALNPNDPIVAKLKAYGIGGFQSIARSPERELKIEIGLLTNNTTDKVLSLLDRIGDASDFAQRRAIYKRVLKETGDETLALIQANNVIDFMKRGAAQHAQFLARNVAFMNAYAQSIDVLSQTLAGGGLKGKARSKAIATMAATGALLSSMTILYAIGASMDPEYEKLDDQTKLRNIFIPFSKQMFGEPILIPVGTSASFFFKAVPEMLYNYVITQGTETEVDKTRLKKALWEATKDSLLGPDPVPTGVKPFLEIALNRNFFTGRPLTPDNLKGTEAAEQYNSSTSELGKIISAGTSIPGTSKRALTPIEADQIVRGLFGSAGALAMWGSNMMSGERPDPITRELPLVGSFVAPPVARGREDLFYDMKERVDKKYDTFQLKLNRLKGDELAKYIEDNADLIGFHGYTEGMADQLQELNRIIRLFSEGQMEGITPKEKRKTITELQQAKQDSLQGIEQLRKAAGL